MKTAGCRRNSIIREKPRPEKSAQRLFFAIAYAYCKANNIDLTPEADTGNGPVDFKLSTGFSGRVLVEIKLSTNTKGGRWLFEAARRYREAEEAAAGYYVVLDVGQMGRKHERLIAARKRCYVGRTESVADRGDRWNSQTVGEQALTAPHRYRCGGTCRRKHFTTVHSASLPDRQDPTALNTSPTVLLKGGFSEVIKFAGDGPILRREAARPAVIVE